MKKNIIFICLLSFSLHACQEREPVFSSIKTAEASWERGKVPTTKCVLMEYVPKDKYILKRALIKNWLEIIEMPLDSLRVRPDRKDFSIHYLKSTYSTREYFAYEEPRRAHWEDCYNYKTVLGCIDVEACENSDSKINIYLRMKKENVDLKAHEGLFMEYPPMNTDTLLYECDETWQERNKDNELVEYFMKIQKKTGTSGDTNHSSQK